MKHPAWLEVIPAERKKDFHAICNAQKKNVELLSASPVIDGTYTVIANPEMTGISSHETFGHLSKAESVDEN